ncbi:DUF2490 domain-containing protein [Paracrocinitomix mangrovi]|uniref:DUF2490 domain-containing protein n=1 Tax=Paracrocinitomix mangrovi TaxID=2862509 RepID=UPI001C8DAF44|nr:DUF2490 domain-containing protein [Paracrocinitomix mangrovi]UKN00534.1 DUF2490 domain-containing protein [Paracrocinitomix mangrovi]
MIKKLSFILLFFVSFSAVGQKTDAMFWTGVGLDLGITKDLKVEYETQFRLDQNASRLSQYYSELGVGYDLKYGFDAGFVYRYSRKNEGSYYFNESRLCFDISWKYKTEFGLSARLKTRYQHAFDRFKTVNDVVPNKKNTLRFSLKFDYEHPEFKLIQPFISPELFIALPPNNSNVLDTYRVKGGLTFDLPKRHEITVFYMYEHENRNTDNLNHIYCLQYNYSFKSLHKKKK